METALFTESDLSALMTAHPPLAVSILMPTHVAGRDIRQGPIRLKNLAGEARERLVATGMARRTADEFLRPAFALVDDYAFWQHRSEGLALFLDGAEPRVYTLPIVVTEHVVVGPDFHVRPLLPVLAADGRFMVLTIQAEHVALYGASRFALSEDDAAGLPAGIDDGAGEPDYENPLQASPVGRPHTASISVTRAQVYGDSPAEWRKRRLVDFVRRVAAALDAHLADAPVPVVLVADAEIAGHFRQATGLGERLAGVVETNPAAMDNGALHAAAYEVVHPRLDGARTDALERFRALAGTDDDRAVTGVARVVSAAGDGRVDTLLLKHDEVANPVEAGSADPLGVAAAETLQHGGAIHLLDEQEWPEAFTAAAILRY